MQDIFALIEEDLGLAPPPAATPELGFFEELTQGKMPKIHNVQYWLKHELFVYTHLMGKNWLVSKPHGAARQQVSIKELTRGLLEYYFLMAYHARFHNERAKERGMLVDMDKFLDLVLDYPTIQKLINNPRELV